MIIKLVNYVKLLITILVNGKDPKKCGDCPFKIFEYDLDYIPFSYCILFLYSDLSPEGTRLPKCIKTFGLLQTTSWDND